MKETSNYFNNYYANQLQCSYFEAMKVMKKDLFVLHNTSTKISPCTFCQK